MPVVELMHALTLNKESYKKAEVAMFKGEKNPMLVDTVLLARFKEMLNQLSQAGRRDYWIPQLSQVRDVIILATKMKKMMKYKEDKSMKLMKVIKYEEDNNTINSMINDGNNMTGRLDEIKKYDNVLFYNVLPCLKFPLRMKWFF